MITLKIILVTILVLLQAIQIILYFAKCKELDKYKEIVEFLNKELIERRKKDNEKIN